MRERRGLSPTEDSGGAEEGRSGGEGRCRPRPLAGRTPFGSLVNAALRLRVLKGAVRAVVIGCRKSQGYSNKTTTPFGKSKPPPPFTVFCVARN